MKTLNLCLAVIGQITPQSLFLCSPHVPIQPGKQTG